MAESVPAADSCLNEEQRIEQGTPGLALSDCRAYELVTPGSLLSQNNKPGRASSSGNAVSYYSTFPAEDAQSSGYFYLSTRGSNSWAVRTISPQVAPAAFFDGTCEQNIYPSDTLTRNILEEGWFSTVDSAHCKRVQDVLVPGEPSPFRNVFIHDVATGSYQLANSSPVEATPSNAKFQDVSDDFSRVAFSEEAKLTPESPAGNNLFLWTEGLVRLVTFLPNGIPVAGDIVESAAPKSSSGNAVSGSGLAPPAGAMSADGRRIFFYAGNGLYLRRNADQPQSPVEDGVCTDPTLACTVQVDASRGSGKSGGGVFWRADPAASRVLFTAENKLTADSTAVSGKADLYEYDVESDQLVDLTVNSIEPADVRGVSGASEDGSYVYFVANGVLAPGASPGKCRGSNLAGQTCNLYLAHEGYIKLVATLVRGDRLTWQEPNGATSIPRRRFSDLFANTSSNGRFLAFLSTQSLTGYDNRDARTGSLNRQIFLYEADANGGTGELICASCIPGGTRPVDPTLAVRFAENYGPASMEGHASWKQNVVLDNGSVFFDTVDALVATDRNGHRDVYEYRGGTPRLISTGTYLGHSRLLAISSTGSDVFFRTPQALVPSDTDNGNTSVYDARVGGGFVEPAPPPVACEGESCRRAPLPAPSPFSVGTATFRAPGNEKTDRPIRRAGKRRCKGRGIRLGCKRGKHRGKAARRPAAGPKRGAGR